MQFSPVVIFAFAIFKVAVADERCGDIIKDGKIIQTLTTRPVCPTFCTKEKSPRCYLDSTGKWHTFDNECEAQVAICENPGIKYDLVRYGECDDRCEKICEGTFDPVCYEDSFSGGRVTFANQCKADIEICKYPFKYRFVKNGSCAEVPKCPTDLCPQDIIPQCYLDSTGKWHTFGNQCEAEIAICENPGIKYDLVRYGVCDDQCKIICEGTSDPVCYQGMFYGGRITFANQCEADIEMCKHPMRYSFFKYGSCETS